MILTPLQKLPKNGEDWGKLIVAKGFKKLPKVQNIAQSGHTGHDPIAPQHIDQRPHRGLHGLIRNKLGQLCNTRWFFSVNKRPFYAA